MRLYLQLFICLMMFLVFAGCGSKMPCTVGLTLKPGESCHYTDNDDDFSFDIEFSAINGGASFPHVHLISPNAAYGPGDGPTARLGSESMVNNGDQMLSVNSSTAAICSGQGLNQKCFTARRNSDGSWTITGIPFPKKMCNHLNSSYTSRG